jgi:hypothetical protein
MEKKSIMVIMIITILASLTGCRLANIDDVYSMSESDIKKATVATSASVDGESKWHDCSVYYTMPSDEEAPQILNMGNSIKLRKSNLICRVDEAYVTHDFKDVYKYEDDESIEQLSTYLDTYEKNVYIDEEANICKSSKGIDMDMIIFRLNVTNTGEKAEPFLATGLYYYDIKYDDNGNLQCNTIYDDNFRPFLVKPDDWVEHKYDRITINEGESKDIVLLCFIEKYKVTRYKSHYSADEHKTIYDDVETDGLMLDNDIYIGTNYTVNHKTGRKEIYDEDELLKLDFTYSDKLK